MEQQTQTLEAAVYAAGMATVYNADDWARIVEKRPRYTFEDDARPPLQASH